MNCTYFCYSGIYVGSTSSFMFLIPFGNWTRDHMTTPVAPAVLTPVGDTGNYSWANNNILESISTMKLRAATDSVFITGGSYVGNYFTPGQVANVALASNLLTTQTQVKYIFLRTLNLQPMVSDLAGMFPASVQRIALNNDLIDKFPPGFSKFTSLKQLFLNYNTIASVDASMGLDTIAELELVGNQVQHFDAVFPDLTKLALAVNQLSEIPSVLVKYPRLEQLWLNNNTISKVTEVHEMDTLTAIDLSYNLLTDIPPILFNHTKLATV
uniref:Leucine-rich repeat-containing N-terminal plant-type domain-containing protein n=1 Tax=Globisporangium ultimum (strain ATCC 200006 / CBS 805.95 / DAOM BR144) TaxID=431595 RepID=K3X7J3_GLOUD